MNAIHRVEFIWNFTRKNKPDDCFDKIYFNNSPLHIHYKTNHLAPKVIAISLFPSYLTHKVIKHDAYHLKKIKQFNLKGAGITFDNSFKLKKLIPRLEHAFNISYEYNFGHITEKKCAFLLNTLHEMLKKRFDQKEEQNNYLLFWDTFTKDIFNSINQGKTSLFVAYDDKKPISISLNYHIADCMMHSEINAFDVDYSKYGLGHLGNKLLINWCIHNKYRFLDMGNGLMGYKQHICNTFYDFEYYIYYKKKSVFAFVLAHKEVLKLHTKNLIKLLILKLNTIKQKITKIRITKKPNTKNLNYTRETLHAKPQIRAHDLKSIHIDDYKYSFLRKPIYDYLYDTKQHINTISVYEITSNKNSFLIKGSTGDLILNFEY
ncbi:GNAT family N-acetyltransferase [Mariniflexile ostreae]|uniref:GNAT family N-acetyltransferase n=1 Tax=Mariniflexile ostreae TaxID=1520892 RepID=A0ABV5FDN2_9FLAO